MPTYEYACKSCGQHLEVVQSFTADPLTTCPACGGTLRKVFGSIGISFKGSGFYRNDSRAAANGSRAGKGKEAAGTESAGASSSESGSGGSGSAGGSGSGSGGSGSAGGSGSGSGGSGSGGSSEGRPASAAAS